MPLGTPATSHHTEADAQTGQGQSSQQHSTDGHGSTGQQGEEGQAGTEDGQAGPKASSWFSSAAGWFRRKPVQSGAGSLSLGAQLAAAASAVRREVAAAVLPEESTPSLTRVRSEAPAPPPTLNASSALAVSNRPRSRWRQHWDEMQEKVRRQSSMCSSLG